MSDVVVSAVPGGKFKLETAWLKDGVVCVDVAGEKNFESDVVEKVRLGRDRNTMRLHVDINLSTTGQRLHPCRRQAHHCDAPAESVRTPALSQHLTLTLCLPVQHSSPGLPADFQEGHRGRCCCRSLLDVISSLFRCFIHFSGILWKSSTEAHIYRQVIIVRLVAAREQM